MLAFRPSAARNGECIARAQPNRLRKEPSMTKKNPGDPAHPPLQAGDALRDRRPRSVRLSRLRQSAGLSRLDRALSDGRGLRRAPLRYLYGRRGTPTSEALAGALARTRRPRLRRRGAAAVRTGGGRRSRCWSALEAGDHVLVTDSVYLPTRKFCDSVLKRYGVTTTYYDPLIGGGISALMQPNTRAVYLESPGSLSFEVQDVPAIAAAAHAKGARRADGQYLGEPALFPRARQRRRSRDPVRHQIHRRAFRRDARHGLPPTRQPGRGSPTRCFTMGQLRRPRRHVSRPARPAHDGGAARASAPVGSGQSRAGSNSGPEVARVLHPALERSPATPSGSATSPAPAACSASCSSRCREAAVNAFVNELTLFGIGASWGGYESLAIPFDCASTCAPRPGGRRAVRRCASTSGSKTSTT